ncbi:MAG: hypothetical protein P4M00_00715 [Azospirillaceae bacterium]|nr:hypothetical protein [Azospirillaceae bacterium]
MTVRRPQPGVQIKGQTEWHPSQDRQPQREIKLLIGVLEQRAQKIMLMANAVAENGLHGRVSEYLALHDRIAEVQALTALLEQRLSDLPEDRAGPLRAQFEQLDLLVMTMLVRSSKRFFAGLEHETILPLGAKDLFLDEDRRLATIATRLQAPHYADRLPRGILTDLGEASRLIQSAAARATSLPAFD